ncbi:MAG: hypothetical protein JSR76_01560 [Verrucomicrobia bacterium]|nr:hypothetical protein [Verrucomicrobiota bacterium]
MLLLNQHVLETKQTLAYLEDNLKGTNALSNAVLRETPFKEGEFYTFFPSGIQEHQMYNFTSGGIAGKVRHKLSYLIMEELEKAPKLTCIFDDIGATYTDGYEDELFSKTGAHYGEEVYYIISSGSISKALLDTCLYASNGAWHSLCVLSAVPKTEDRSLTSEEINEIAKKAELLILGAYDAEGFIFWRRR